MESENDHALTKQPAKQKPGRIAAGLYRNLCG
jgi:hypothetical protein